MAAINLGATTYGGIMRRIRTASTALTGLAALVALGVVAVTSPAQAVGETCQGRAATIVGTGPDVQGTPGDDVIVTGASNVAYGNAGNDLICTLAGSPENVFVDSGEGDDVVDTSASSAPRTVVQLGVGRDRHIGGLAIDEVYADGSDDTVSANFVVMTITGPVSGQPGTYTSGPDATAGPSTHGPHVVVMSANQDVEVDLERQVVLVEGVRAADLDGFRAAGVVAPRAVVRGNSEDNFLRASGCRMLIVGEDGDDILDGYAGEDAPAFDCVSEATMRGGSGDDVVTGWVGRNRLFGDAGKDALTGGERPDVLVGGSGRDELNGLEGPDVLRGNSGNDVLKGKQGRDRLFGNGGVDKAAGGEGQDLCIAERTSRCER